MFQLLCPNASQFQSAYSSTETALLIAYIMSANHGEQHFLVSHFWSRALCGQMSIYLADNIHLVSEGNRRSLRSSSDNMCAVPRTHNSFRNRSFGAVGPRIWNTLRRPTDTGHLTSATNILRRCWRHNVSTRPRRFVTFYISALEIFLLTYLLYVTWSQHCLLIVWITNYLADFYHSHVALEYRVLLWAD